MTSVAWENRLCNLIKKLKPSADLAAFRNDYRDTLQRASANGHLAKGDVTLLLEARPRVFSWTRSNTTMVS